MIDSTPIMMNAMKIVERKLLISASLNTLLRRIGMNILDRRRAVIIKIK